MRFMGAAPQQASIQPGTVPAPMGGINSVASLATMQPTDAIYTHNIDASARGLHVRPGYAEYANGYSGDEVKTVIPYEGTAEDGSEDLLLACTSVGIYDISASTTTPTAVVTWGTSSSSAGWCSYEVFTNDAGARILLVCDLANGLKIYTESTQTWSTPTITGPSGGAADLVYVLLWKKRVWYIEAGTNSAWYTDSGTYSGTVTEFNFGNKFNKGGFLKSLHAWTLDSGIGPDDYIVALSSAGDVLVYAGTNPSSSATFGSVGSWYIGDLPAGRRCGLSVGGDLYLLSSYGIISAKDLLSGVNPFTYEGSLSYKINRNLRAAITNDITSMGWEIQILPDLAKLVVIVPKETNQPYTQYVFDINLRAWSIWTGVPMTTVITWKNTVYTGAALKVHTITGSLDNVLLASPDPQPIYWSFLTAYNELQSPQMNKVVEFIRPRFIAEGEPSYKVRAFYDYDLSELTQASAASTGSDVWDTGVWDTAIWGGGITKFQLLEGANGMGRTVAIAMAGATVRDTTLVDIGVMWRSSVNSRGML